MFMRFLLIFLSIAFGAYSAYSGLKWKKLHLLARILVVLGIVASFGLGVFSYIDYLDSENEKDIGATFGEIQARQFRSPNIHMKVRGSTAPFTSRTGKINFNFVDNELRIAKVNEKLYAHVTLRDVDGSVVAVVDGDYWKIYKQGYDYNNDKTGFEVVTPDKRVLFQIDLKMDTAFFAGLVVNSKGDGLYFYPDPMGSGGALIQTIEDGKSYYGDFALSYDWIKRMFKYPRERYPHHREEIQ